MYSIPQNVLRNPLYFIYDECVMNPNMLSIENLSFIYDKQPDHKTLYDILLHIKRSHSNTNGALLETFWYKPIIEKVACHNMEFLNNILDTGYKTIIYHCPELDVVEHSGEVRWNDVNIYGNILMEIRDKYRYFQNHTLEEIIHDVFEKINAYLLNACCNNVCFISGEYALKKAERVYNKDNIWSPSSVVFLITNDPKYNLFKQLRHHIFKDFIVKSFDPRDICFMIPMLNFKIHFQPLSSNVPYETCFMASNSIMFGNNGTETKSYNDALNIIVPLTVKKRIMERNIYIDKKFFANYKLINHP
jgi:hypothetical protein